MITNPWIPAFGILLSLACAAPQQAQDYWVYVGAYTGEKNAGIHAFRYNPAQETVVALGCVAETKNPTFLAVHPKGTHLYAVNETSGFRGDQGGSISAYQLNRRTGQLTLLNQEASVGNGPCHLVVDATGSQVLAANYGGGSVVSLPIRDDGSLGPARSVVQHTGSSVNPGRQKEPHAHSVNLSPDNRFAFVADLGTDRLYTYGFDPENGLSASAAPHSPSLAPGSGPRHFAFHPSGRFAYVINELLSTVTVFEYSPGTGAMSAVQTLSTLPDDFAGNTSTAEIVVHPNGQFLYGSNRGHDSLVIFHIDDRTGRLRLIGHEPTGGRTPRNFNLDPTGSTVWVGNQSSDSVILFRVNTATGRLTSMGQELQLGSPVCFKFVAVEK
jgi:6-phosphogluconolactonase